MMRVLIVENSAIIAMHLASFVTEHESVGLNRCGTL
jgi:hypothetical protein